MEPNLNTSKSPNESNKSSVTNSLLSGKLSSKKKPLVEPGVDEWKSEGHGRLFFWLLTLMTEQHPITLPAELVDKWVAMLEYCEDIDVFTDVVRWGYDQAIKELEAFLEKLNDQRSLKEQALGALYAIATGADDTREFYQDIETIKAALETLPNN